MWYVCTETAKDFTDPMPLCTRNRTHTHRHNPNRDAHTHKHTHCMYTTSVMT